MDINLRIHRRLRITVFALESSQHVLQMGLKAHAILVQRWNECSKEKPGIVAEEAGALILSV